mmetsp:Transcript_149662/g.261574  ORF Transcript_149662/g.261574 Transcript_149662/m.261574 type:complete len:80 (+) Transcript_149662:554-793(+)
MPLLTAGHHAIITLRGLRTGLGHDWVAKRGTLSSTLLSMRIQDSKAVNDVLWTYPLQPPTKQSTYNLLSNAVTEVHVCR